MTGVRMQPDLIAFFDAYRHAFSEGPAATAAFYAEPCVTARGGVVCVIPSSAETMALFTEIDRQYRGRGFTHADYALLDSRDLGANSAMATLRWAYKNAAGGTIWETTFSYNLYRRHGAWKILVLTTHDQ